MPSITISVDALRSKAFGSITNSYTVLGSTFAHPMRTLRLVNTTDADMLISFDTVNDNIILPAGSFVLYDICANTETTQFGFFLRTGTQLYVKYVSAPTLGTVYAECTYGSGE